MAYLGQGPFQEFTNPPTKDSFTGDGSTTAFDMSAEVPSGAQNALEVYVDNVRQEPGSGKAFTLGVDGSNDNTRITFSAAPANGASIYVINDKTNTSVTAPLNNDLNGTELILDGDGDTSITADADDRVDFKIGAVEAFSFSESTGDTIVKIMTDAKDIKFQQYDGRTLLDINDGGWVGVANGATGPGQLRLYEDTDLGTNFTAFQVGTQSADITYTLPTADGTSDYKLTTNASGVLSWTASHLPTSADGQALGSATLEWSDLFLADGGVINLGADQDTTLTHVADTGILLNSTRQLQFGDSGTYIHQSADGVLDLVSDTEIEINATTIDINGAVQISGTTTIVGNLILGSASLNEASLEILDGATVTTDELNLIDGGATVGTTAIADGDGLLINDAGVMRVSTVQTLAAYLDDEITAMPNLVTTAATTVGVLGSGSIAAGFGAIDNGASNITTGGLLSLDVDADANDVSGDSATGRLTLGAAQDLNLYHGGTDSYIVNDTGDLILKTGASDEDMIFQGNDGGAAITALTLDMSAAGAATFNSTVTATGLIIGSASVTEAQLEILDGATVTTTELNLIDGGTARGTTAVASGDGILINDAGTMAMTNVDTVSTYFASHSVGGGNIVTTGALNSGSITSGFGAIDNGASAITTTGIITGGTVEATTDTAAADNAAMGYTAAEGLILTGQGSTNDVTIKNDADADVIEIPTGTTNVTVAGNLGVGGTAVAKTDTDTSNTGNVTLDFSANQNFVLTLTGNTTLVNPSTEQVGQSGFIACIQDGTGSRTLSLGTDYETAAAAGITLTTTAAATDLIPYLVVASNRILLGQPQLAFS